MTRRLALLAFGVSTLTIAAVQAAERADDTPCRRCDRRPVDNRLEHGVLDPNLEWGGADDAFRVTVDGAIPAGAVPAASDAQRATDLALAAARIDVQVTALRAQPMLSVVTARPVTGPGEPVTFFPLSNYVAFVARAELRVFAEARSTAVVPLATIPVTLGKPVEWLPDVRDVRLRVVLRVIDAGGRFDETASEGFAVSSAPVASHDRRDGPLFENQRTTGNIGVVGSEVTVSGTLTDWAQPVALMGVAVPVDRNRPIVTACPG